MPAAISLCQLYGTYGAEQSGMEAKLFNFNAGNLTEFSNLRMYKLGYTFLFVKFSRGYVLIKTWARLWRAAGELDAVNRVRFLNIWRTLGSSQLADHLLLAKKNLEFHAQVQKCRYGNFSFLPKWHFWTRAWNSKIFLAKSILLKHYENGDKKFFS